MKSLRLILALSFANLLALSVAHAGDDKPKSKPDEKPCAKAECGKKEKDDKSNCAVESKSGCCDTGDKVKSDKPEEAKK